MNNLEKLFLHSKEKNIIFLRISHCKIFVINKLWQQINDLKDHIVNDL